MPVQTEPIVGPVRFVVAATQATNPLRSPLPAPLTTNRPQWLTRLIKLFYSPERNTNQGQLHVFSNHGNVRVQIPVPVSNSSRPYKWTWRHLTGLFLLTGAVLFITNYIWGAVQKARRVAEEKRIADEKAAEERKRAEEERKRAEEERKRAEEERKRAAEERKRAAEERKRAEEEKRRAEEEAAEQARQEGIVDGIRLAMVNRKIQEFLTKLREKVYAKQLQKQSTAVAQSSSSSFSLAPSNGGGGGGDDKSQESRQRSIDAADNKDSREATQLEVKEGAEYRGLPHGVDYFCHPDLSRFLDTRKLIDKVLMLYPTHSGNELVMMTGQFLDAYQLQTNLRTLLSRHKQVLGKRSITADHCTIWPLPNLYLSFLLQTQILFEPGSISGDENQNKQLTSRISKLSHSWQPNIDDGWELKLPYLTEEEAYKFLNFVLESAFPEYPKRHEEEFKQFVEDPVAFVRKFPTLKQRIAALPPVDKKAVDEKLRAFKEATQSEHTVKVQQSSNASQRRILFDLKELISYLTDRVKSQQIREHLQQVQPAVIVNIPLLGRALTAEYGENRILVVPDTFKVTSSHMIAPFRVTVTKQLPAKTDIYVLFDISGSMFWVLDHYPQKTPTRNQALVCGFYEMLPVVMEMGASLTIIPYDDKLLPGTDEFLFVEDVNLASIRDIVRYVEKISKIGAQKKGGTAMLPPLRKARDLMARRAHLNTKPMLLPCTDGQNGDSNYQNEARSIFASFNRPIPVNFFGMDIHMTDANSVTARANGEFLVSLGNREGQLIYATGTSITQDFKKLILNTPSLSDPVCFTIESSTQQKPKPLSIVPYNEPTPLSTEFPLALCAEFGEKGVVPMLFFCNAIQGRYQMPLSTIVNPVSATPKDEEQHVAGEIEALMLEEGEIVDAFAAKAVSHQKTVLEKMLKSAQERDLLCVREIETRLEKLKQGGRSAAVVDQGRLDQLVSRAGSLQMTGYKRRPHSSGSA